MEGFWHERCRTPAELITLRALCTETSHSRNFPLRRAAGSSDTSTAHRPRLTSPLAEQCPCHRVLPVGLGHRRIDTNEPRKVPRCDVIPRAEVELVRTPVEAGRIERLVIVVRLAGPQAVQLIVVQGVAGGSGDAVEEQDLFSRTSAQYESRREQRCAEHPTFHRDPFLLCQSARNERTGW